MFFEELERSKPLDCGSALHGICKNSVAVIIVEYQNVAVSSAGFAGEMSGQISVDLSRDLEGFRDDDVGASTQRLFWLRLRCRRGLNFSWLCRVEIASTLVQMAFCGCN